MEQEQIAALVNNGILSLCRSCTPNCLRKIVDNKFPECYEGNEGGRQKFIQLMEALANSDEIKTDRELGEVENYIHSLRR